MWRRPALLGCLGLGVLFSAAPAHAEGGTYRLFIAGPTLGEPGTAKQATEYTLYGLAGASTLAGGYFLWSWSSARNERDDFNQREPMPCFDPTAPLCAQDSRYARDVNQALTLALGSFAAGASFALSGVVIARYWPNLTVEPQLMLAPSSAFAGASLKF